jgi:phospholipid/cholesterol/gamma-HCH transport system substrate-binding protein
MRSYAAETKVGVFVIIGALVLAVGTSMVGKLQWGKPKGYTVTAVFGSVSGLEEKSPVRVAGVRVGDVEKIWLQDGLAYVRMRLTPEAVMREDSEVTITSLGLLGEKYIEISSGTMARPKVKAGSTIHGKDVVSMDKLIAEFTDIAENIKAVTASLKTFFGPEDQKSPLRELMKNFDDFVKNVNSLITDNRQTVNHALKSIDSFATRADGLVADNSADVRAAIRNFRDLSENLQTQVNNLSSKISRLGDDVGANVAGARKDFGDGMAEIKKTAARLGEASDSLKAILDKARAGEGTVGKLLTDDSAFRNLNRALESVAAVSKKIDSGEGTIGKLVNKDDAYNSLQETIASANNFLKKTEAVRMTVGFRTEYLLSPDDMKSYFSVRVNPQPDKFYLVEAVYDPNGRRRIYDRTNTVSVDGGTPMVVTEHEVVYEDSFMFTLLLGKRFGDFTLRGGLMESTGGIGADWWFLNDKGRLTLDMWDFQRDDANPHLKVSGNYTFYKNLFVNAGVDDIIEDKKRSVFLGAGFYFSDDDIKYVLGLTGMGK